MSGPGAVGIGIGIGTVIATGKSSLYMMDVLMIVE
jgi:hypothetical protein